MKLLVSIHDVTPAHENDVRRLWEMCRDVGVTPALLVVPRWHGEIALEDSPAFVQWIRECAAAGAEIFLHGERHDEVGSPRRLSDRVRALGRTDGEGEFLTLNLTECRTRIDRGLALLRRLQLNPIGFVAPAWLASGDCELAVQQSGLEISETDAEIILHTRGQRVRSPVIRWSARTNLRAILSSVVADLRWAFQRSRGIVRIALHPADLRSDRCARSIRETLARWTTVSSQGRYAEL